MAHRWLLRDVDVDGSRVDCRIADGTVRDVSPGLSPEASEEVIEGYGGALLPGLADHHLHLRAAAAARHSVDATGVRELSQLSVPAGNGWLRLVGVDDFADSSRLSAAFPDRPVRAQHRSGALWTLNAAAIQRLAGDLEPAERASGRLWRDDRRLRRLLAVNGAAESVSVAGLAAELARLGTTHVTDATADLSDSDIADLDSAIPQHLLSLAVAVPAPAPKKVLIADHEPPDLGALIAAVTSAHDDSRPVAIHAVSAVALAIAIGVLDSVGTLEGDRIEHAAVCSDDAADRIAELGVVVITQPGIWSARGSEMTARIDPSERHLLWRYGTLLDRGVRVAVSSDAPYGSGDPWNTIRAAATRDGPDRVAPDVALRSLLADPLDPGGPPRTVRRGAPADLLLLDCPLATALARLEANGAGSVRAVWCGGRWI